VHGGVRDVCQYMAGPAQIAENARYLAEDFPGARVCFYGHSHQQKVFKVTSTDVQEVPADGEVALGPEDTYFINPGSVDASRKSRGKLAEYALFDSGAGTVEFLRVPYDCAATEAKAATFGYRIPPLVERLYIWRKRIQKQGQTTFSFVSKVAKHGTAKVSEIVSRVRKRSFSEA
jgi:hypothetical protein